MKRLFLACVGVAARRVRRRRPTSRRGRRRPTTRLRFVPVYNWSGFYIGINGGGAFGTSAWDLTGSFNTSGGLVGGTIGYNYQVGQAVFGVEGDVDWAEINGTPTTLPVGCKTSDTWLSTVRGRLGYAADRFMPFVTGGAAFGDIRASPRACRRQTDQGRLDLGGGLEFAWPATGRQGRISLCRSRQVQLRHRLRAGLATDNVSFTSNISVPALNFRY